MLHKSRGGGCGCTCSNENSGAIYCTETYDENVMSVVYSEYGLVCVVGLCLQNQGRRKQRKLRTCEGVKPQMQVINDVDPCHDLLASAV
jgi:hypothetical protein